jgi:hypothetical protein
MSQIRLIVLERSIPRAYCGRWCCRNITMSGNCVKPLDAFIAYRNAQMRNGPLKNAVTGPEASYSPIIKSIGFLKFATLGVTYLSWRLFTPANRRGLTIIVELVFTSGAECSASSEGAYDEKLWLDCLGICCRTRPC